MINWTGKITGSSWDQKPHLFKLQMLDRHGNIVYTDYAFIHLFLFIMKKSCKWTVFSFLGELFL